MVGAGLPGPKQFTGLLWKALLKHAELSGFFARVSSPQAEPGGSLYNGSHGAAATSEAVQAKPAYRMKKTISITLAVLCCAAVFLAAGFYRYSTTPPKNGPGVVTVVIPPGSSLTSISILLNEKGLVAFPRAFTLLAKLSDAEHGIKSGEYRFETPPAPRDLLGKLTRGEVLTHAVTIPEGSTLSGIARIVEAAGLAPARAVLAVAADASFIHLLQLDTNSLEGFVFPDTYRFSRGTSARNILKKMVERFNDVLEQERRSAALPTHLSVKALVTLASLVEKETALASEKPLIAAVFLNRLQKGMRLECDPTVIYGLRQETPGFQGRLRKKHLHKKTPYNTYQISGLPPGPICSPGRESMRAVLNPATVDYLYFVSRNDGTHKFSKTFREHNRAVITYQKRRK